MSLEIEGRIVRKLNVQSGTSARGAWEKQEFVVEIQEGNFPSQVCMNVWGADKVRELEKYQVGDRVKIAFNLSSREYNGRWYTDVRAWRIDPAGSPAQGGQTDPAGYAGRPDAAGSRQDSYQGGAAPMPTVDDMPADLADHPLFPCFSVRPTSVPLLNIRFSGSYQTFWAGLFLFIVFFGNMIRVVFSGGVDYSRARMAASSSSRVGTGLSVKIERMMPSRSEI